MSFKPDALQNRTPIDAGGTLESKETEFRVWLKKYFQNLYASEEDPTRLDSFYDPVEEKILEYAPYGRDERIITREQAELTRIFAKELVVFVNMMIFQKGFSDAKRKRFLGRLYEQLFSKSPDIFENLNIDFALKLRVLAQLNEVPDLHNNHIPQSAGEIAYDLSFGFEDPGAVEALAQKIESWPPAQILSVIKLLGYSARWAEGNGEWAHRAHHKCLLVLKLIRERSRSPIVAFACNLEIQNVIDFTEDAPVDRSFLETKVEVDQDKIKETLHRETNMFLSDSGIVPELDGVQYSRVSSDYIGVTDRNTWIPFALVSKPVNSDPSPERFLTLDQESIRGILQNFPRFHLGNERYLYLGDRLMKIIGGVNDPKIFFQNVPLQVLERCAKIIKSQNSFNWKLSKMAEVAESYEHNFLSDLESVCKEKEPSYTYPLISYEGLTQQRQLNPLGNEDFSHIVKFLHSPEIRAYLNSLLGIQIESISLREQIHFLRFLSEADMPSYRRLEKILTNSPGYTQDILRSFLSMSGSPDLGEKILDLGEDLPQEVASQIFKKYGEIVEVASNLNQAMAALLPEGALGSSQSYLGDIEDSLLRRAQKLILAFHDKRGVDPDGLLESLERYKTEILLYADVYRRLNETGEKITMESLRDTKMEVLTDEEKQKLGELLWAITKANRPFITDPLKLEKRREEFFTTVANPASAFYVLKHKGEVVAFCSATPDSDGNLYVESLNVESEVKGSKIGSEFFPAVIEKLLGQGKDIYGYVHERNAGTLPYYERIGFAVQEVEINGEKKYEIRLKGKEAPPSATLSQTSPSA